MPYRAAFVPYCATFVPYRNFRERYFMRLMMHWKTHKKVPVFLLLLAIADNEDLFVETRPKGTANENTEMDKIPTF